MWQMSQPGPVLLQLLMSLLLLLVAEPASALVASTRRGRDRRLINAGKIAEATGISQTQCQLVCQQHNCGSFNHHAESGSCEVFSVTACQSNSYYLTQSAGWSWYDVVTDLTAESNQTLWQQEACVRDGRCRDSCLRQLGQSCRHSDQCQHLVSGPTSCSSGSCQCASDHWQFNDTLCLPKDQQLFTDGEFWVWKKIVNGLCSTQFNVMSGGGVTIVLAEAFTHSSNRYVFTLSQSDINARRIEEGKSDSQIGSSRRTLLSGDKFRLLSMHWCSGKIRFSEVGHSNSIQWDDRSRFNPAYIAIYSTPQNEGRWRFPERLVDPWFGDWSPTRVYSIPRDTWILRRRTEQDFWVEFECRIAWDCMWKARQQNTWHDADIWKVVIGGWGNTASAIHRHVSVTGWHTYSHTSTPAILSATEFRRFRIHFTPERISVYRADEQEPFMAHDVIAPFTINFDGPFMCCNQGNIEYRLVQYDSGWSYEGGFRWGENLVD